MSAIRDELHNAFSDAAKAVEDAIENDDPDAAQAALDELHKHMRAAVGRAFQPIGTDNPPEPVDD